MLLIYIQFVLPLKSKLMEHTLLLLPAVFPAAPLVLRSLAPGEFLNGPREEQAK